MAFIPILNAIGGHGRDNKYTWIFGQDSVMRNCNCCIALYSINPAIWAIFDELKKVENIIENAIDDVEKTIKKTVKRNQLESGRIPLQYTAMTAGTVDIRFIKV